MPRIVFVQRDVSQLDEPVYAKIHELDPQACAVIYWNDYGYTRKHLDPELGLVPDLSDSAGTSYPRSWLDSRLHSLGAVMRAVALQTPRIVVVSDIPHSFETVAALRPHACLIALGDGPQLPEIRNYCTARGRDRVYFPGFVPFRELQNYFFAADTFLHFAEREPWGVSPQDALIAGLGLVTSDRVGAGLVFLEGDLARFVVPLSDNAAAVERMIELCDHPAGAARFAAARAKAEGYTVVSCASRWAGLSIE
jgi:glycosyltransferase involved in cell wall biosynthesis